MPSFYRDDNAESLGHCEGMRKAGGTGRAVTGTMGAAVVEVALGGLTLTVAKNEHNAWIARLATTTQPAYYAFGAAGLAASFTAANMVLLPAGSVEYTRVDSPDVSFYHLQAGAAGTINLAVME